MEKDLALVRFSAPARGIEDELLIPLFITAAELVDVLNEAYRLGIDTTDAGRCFLRAEDPFRLVRGARSLSELGIRNGTRLLFREDQR